MLPFSETPPRVPLSVRNFVSNLCEKPVFEELGIFYYQKVLSRAVESLKDKAGVAAVSLRGGLLNKCRPGISDIDLTVYLEPGVALRERASQILKIRETYQKLKNRYFVLGELRLVSPTLLEIQRELAPSASLRYQEERFFTHPIASVAPAGVKSSLKIFSLAFDHFVLAFRYHEKWIKTGSPYYALNRNRELLKVISFCEGTPPRLNLFAHAFKSLDQIAKKGLAEKLPSHSEVKIDFSGISMPHPEDISLTYLGSRVLERKLGFKGRLTPSDVPYFMKFDGSEVDPFFETFHGLDLQEYLRQWRHLPLLLSSAMEECFLLGWPNGKTLSHLLYVPKDNRKDGMGDKFSSHCFESVLDGTFTHLNCLYESLIGGSFSQTIHWLRATARNTLWLETKHFTQDSQRLVSWAPSHLKHCKDALNEEFGYSFELILCAIEEIEASILHEILRLR